MMVMRCKAYRKVICDKFITWNRYVFNIHRGTSHENVFYPENGSNLKMIVERRFSMNHNAGTYKEIRREQEVHIENKEQIDEWNKEQTGKKNINYVDVSKRHQTGEDSDGTATVFETFHKDLESLKRKKKYEKEIKEKLLPTKTLYEQGKHEEAIETFFKNPNIVAGTYIVRRIGNPSILFKAYRTLKSSSSLNIRFIISLIIKLNKIKYQGEIDYLWDELALLCNSLDSHDPIDIFSYNYGISALSKQGYAKESIILFNHMRQTAMEPDCSSWCAVIQALYSQGKLLEAFETFKKFENRKLKPDGVLILTVLQTGRHYKLIDKTIEIFENMEDRYGIKPNEKHYTCVIYNLSIAHRFNDAIKLIHKMVRKNLEISRNTWNILIRKLTQKGKTRDALKAFETMQELDFNPDIYTLSSVLLAYRKLRDVESCLELFHNMQRLYSVDRDASHYLNVIYLFAETSRIEEAMQYARDLRNQMIPLEPKVWDKLVYYLIGLEKPKEALFMYTEMKKDGFEISDIDPEVFSQGKK